MERVTRPELNRYLLIYRFRLLHRPNSEAEAHYPLCYASRPLSDQFLNFCLPSLTDFNHSERVAIAASLHRFEHGGDRRKQNDGRHVAPKRGLRRFEIPRLPVGHSGFGDGFGIRRRSPVPAIVAGTEAAFRMTLGDVLAIRRSRPVREPCFYFV